MRKRSGRPPRFAAIPNETIDDSTALDLTALGLLTVLLRHRDGWDITLARIGTKYGYGEDAMAAAMGLLQVARYVVKARVRGAGNRWSTEVAVYDTPATDDDVTDLLAAIAEEHPDARHIEVIPPTKAALTKAAKRRAKLGAPRLGEFPDSGATCENTAKPQVAPDSGFPRDSGDPRVTKKTVTKKTTEDETSRPSVPTPEVGAREASGMDGGTDGGGGSVVQEHEPAAASNPGTAPAATPVAPTPGVQLLLAIGAEHPPLLLTGQTLADQGLMATGMLTAGWTPEQLHHVIAGRPLPVPVRTTVGAVVASRLRAAAAGPPPSSAPRIPAQQTSTGWPQDGTGEATPTPPTWAEQQAALDAATGGRGPLADCEGDGGTCPRLAVPGQDQCAEHLGWPTCPACTGRAQRRMPPGAETCERCQTDTTAGPVTDTQLTALLAEATRRATAADAPA